MALLNGKNALNNTIEHCFICGETAFMKYAKDYRCCIKCGHEVLSATKEQGYIINDYLSMNEVNQVTRLDRFKSKTLLRFDSKLERNRLLDIGSASGKFLMQNAWRYECATGLEITPESLIFSRQILGLEIIDDIQDAAQEISTVTAWHSLEHIPEEDLLSLLDNLSSKMTSGGRFVVSVPNAFSWQYHWFGKAYAYYDVPNHLHQFTPHSLRLLMKRFGLHQLESVSSWPYNTFGYTQSLLNILTNTHNYIYYRLKRRSRKPSLFLDIINGLLLIFCIPFGLLFGLVDTLCLERQGVITTCFVKKTS